MNTNETGAWYHCGHCGALFQSDIGLDHRRVCEVCNNRPSVGVWPIVSSASQKASAKVASFDKKGEKVRKITRMASGGKRRLRAAFWISMIWILILLGVVGLRHYFTNLPLKTKDQNQSESPEDFPTGSGIRMMAQALPECDRVFRGFLAANSVEVRSGFVVRALELRETMESFYANEEVLRLGGNALQRTAQEWIRLGDEWMILTHWKDEGSRMNLDVVFRKEVDSWKIDWMHFVRYSEESWEGFQAGNGANEAEFRLLARQLADEKKTSPGKPAMMIVLAAPEWGNPRQIIAESESFLIDPESDNGRLLKADFHLRERQQTGLNGQLAALELEGWIRVRVKVSRDDLVGKYRFVIEELKACHWIDSELSGLDSGNSSSEVSGEK